MDDMESRPPTPFVGVGPEDYGCEERLSGTEWRRGTAAAGQEEQSVPACGRDVHAMTAGER